MSDEIKISYPVNITSAEVRVPLYVGDGQSRTQVGWAKVRSDGTIEGEIKEPGIARTFLGQYNFDTRRVVIDGPEQV